MKDLDRAGAGRLDTRGNSCNEHVAPLRARRQRKLLRRLQTCTHHRTAGIAGCIRRCGGMAARGARSRPAAGVLRHNGTD